MRRHYIEAILTEVAILGVGVLTGLVVARLLQPEGRGLLAVALIWPQVIALIGFCSLGDITCYLLKIRQDRPKETIAGIIVFALICAAVTIALGEMVLRHLAVELPPELSALVRVYLAVFVPANFIVLLWFGVVQSRADFRSYNRLRVSASCAYLAGIGVAWVAGIVSVAVVVVVNLLATVLVAAIAVGRFRALRLGFPWRPDLREVCRLVASFHPATLLAVIASQADQLMATHRLRAVEIGYYVVAVSCANAVMGVIGNGVQRVALAHVAGADRGMARRRGAQALVRTSGAALGACAVGLVAVPWLVPLLYGPEFRDAVTIARWLVVAAGFAAIRTVGVQVMRGSGEAWVGVLASATVAAGVLGLGGLARSGNELAMIAVTAQGLGVVVLGVVVMRWRRGSLVVPGSGVETATP